MKPNFDEWADRIICDNSEGLCGQLNNLPREMSQALRQAWEQGYREAVKTDWWQQIESQAFNGYKDVKDLK
jgi:hypothetical protein